MCVCMYTLYLYPTQAVLYLHFIMMNSSVSHSRGLKILAEIQDEFSNRMLCIGVLDISNYRQAAATEAVL